MWPTTPNHQRSRLWRDDDLALDLDEEEDDLDLEKAVPPGVSESSSSSSCIAPVSSVWLCSSSSAQISEFMATSSEDIPHAYILEALASSPYLIKAALAEAREPTTASAAQADLEERRGRVVLQPERRRLHVRARLRRRVGWRRKLRRLADGGRRAPRAERRLRAGDRDRRRRVARAAERAVAPARRRVERRGGGHCAHSAFVSLRGTLHHQFCGVPRGLPGRRRRPTDGDASLLLIKYAEKNPNFYKI